MENSVIGHTTPAAGDVGGALTAAESGTGIWDGDLGRGSGTGRGNFIPPIRNISGKPLDKLREIVYNLFVVDWRLDDVADR